MINTYSFSEDIDSQIEFILSLMNDYKDVDILNILLRFHQYLISRSEILEKDIDFEPLKNDLIQRYTTKRSAIYEKQYQDCKRVCSFCGRDAGDQLDHFFPKSKFPEFSLFVHNLVPCCSNCNGLKDDEVVGEDIFLVHPFYVNPEKKVLYKLKLKTVIIVNGSFSPELELLIDDSEMTLSELFMAYYTLNLLKIREKVLKRAIDYIRNHLRNKKELSDLLIQYGSINGVAKSFLNKSKVRLETLTVIDYLALEMLSVPANLKLFESA